MIFLLFLLQGVVEFCSMTDAEGKPWLSIFTRFSETGRLFAKKEDGSIGIGPGGLIFTGDGTGLLTVWKSLEEPKVAASS